MAVRVRPWRRLEPEGWLPAFLAASDFTPHTPYPTLFASPHLLPLLPFFHALYTWHLYPLDNPVGPNIRGYWGEAGEEVVVVGEVKLFLLKTPNLHVRPASSLQQGFARFRFCSSMFVYHRGPWLTSASSWMVPTTTPVRLRCVSLQPPLRRPRLPDRRRRIHARPQAFAHQGSVVCGHATCAAHASRDPGRRPGHEGTTLQPEGQDTCTRGVDGRRHSRRRRVGPTSGQAGNTGACNDG